MPNILDLKENHKNKLCYVIGNGPSLTKDQLKESEKYITIGTSGIIFNDIDFMPDYYVLSDFGTIMDSVFWEKMKTISSKIILSGWIIKKMYQFGIINSLDEERKSFLQNSYIVNSINSPTGIPPRLENKESISLDLELGTFVCGTVIMDLSLPLAAYMGCNPIHIIGCDCQPNGHFYDYRTDENDNGPTQKSVIDQYILFAEKFKDLGIELYNHNKSPLSCPGIKKYESSNNST